MLFKAGGFRWANRSWFQKLVGRLLGCDLKSWWFNFIIGVVVFIRDIGVSIGFGLNFIVGVIILGNVRIVIGFR
ncbi:hypothetical protein C2G38_2188469 [Gigaspora rosea]|uniref:Uncharacterized protein n=1 Tax=Gigaspora rosea TaxID=44941 RepID=A0A397V3A8_9GLOM|nr:hypothetical protein C2G38_2188469 [Gigaspora rosea]